MKLFCILAVVLAFALAEESEIPDSEAIASTDVESREGLEASASAYSYIPNDKRYNNAYVPPQNSYNPPQNAYVPPQNSYVPPQNSYVPPQNTYVPPQNTYVPPQNTYVPPQNNYVPPQNNYYPQPTYPSHGYPQTPSSTTTPVPVILNEVSYGDNGSYQYEYQIGDGTHVSEQGYFLNPNTEDESLVKKGWYSYTGPDGKIYTVTWWADHTGFHASGDHLPTPPPIPPAIQASIDKQKEQEAAQNKPQTGYPTQTQKPVYYPTQKPIYYPTQTQKPIYYPTQTQKPVYYPTQPTQYPQQVGGYYPNQGSYYQPSYNSQPSYSSYSNQDTL